MTNQDLAAFAEELAQRFVRRMPWVRHLVDDLTQEAAIALMKARSRYTDGAQSLRSYGAVGAQREMQRYVETMGGALKCVSPTQRMRINGVSLIRHDAPEGSTGWRDDRTVDETQHDDVSFAEVIGRLDERTQLMVEAKMRGATNEEIADGLSVSREYVRKKLIHVAETFGGDL